MTDYLYFLYILFKNIGMAMFVVMVVMLLFDNRDRLKRIESLLEDRNGK